MRARLGWLSILVVTTWLWHGTALACSCLLTSEENSYELSDLVVRGRPIASFRSRSEVWYLVWLTAPSYKGCLRERSLLWVRTEPDEAACGVALKAGVEYLLKGSAESHRLGAPVLHTTLCSGDRPVSELTPAQLAFWSSREICCGESCSCAAKERVACFADPCQLDACNVEGATCRANYCGGCNAEWVDPDGLRVCLPGT